VLPLHALPLSCWFIMMNPGVISGYNVIQEVTTFTVILLQETGADVVTVVLMLFYQMSGHSPCRNFAEPKNVMH
jgi:hypothetical protein